MIVFFSCVIVFFSFMIRLYGQCDVLNSLCLTVLDLGKVRPSIRSSLKHHDFSKFHDFTKYVPINTHYDTFYGQNEEKEIK